MSHDLHHLAGPYVLNALDDDERTMFERHYECCEVCAAEVREFREVAALLAETEQTAPPADLKHKVMADIGRTRQLPPVSSINRQRFGRTQQLLVAAAAVIVLGIGAIAVAFNRTEGVSTNEVVSARDAVVTNLRPTDDRRGMLQVVWSDELDKVAIIGTDLDDPGERLAYELWFLVADGVAPAGVFQPEDGEVSEVLDVEDIDADGWGITIEDEDGSPVPTTPVIFSGTI